MREFQSREGICAELKGHCVRHVSMYSLGNDSGFLRADTRNFTLRSRRLEELLHVPQDLGGLTSINRG